MDHTLKLDGPVAAGAVYTLCSSKLAAKERCDRATSLAFDGNDAVALVCDGATLDVIGQIGVNPGTSWSSVEASAAGAGNGGASGTEASTADQTLRRRCSV